MAKKAINRDLYDHLIDGFREAPGNASFAARRAGCDRRTAARGWKVGWPKQFTWAIPIREVIQQEMEAARAERLRLIEEERSRADRDREKARTDSIRATAEELQAVSVARSNGIATGILLQGLLRAMIPLANRIQDQLKEAELKPREVAKLIGDTAFVVRQGNEAIKTALLLERIRTNQPIGVIGVSTRLDDVTTEEAVEELVGLERTIKRAVKQQNPAGIMRIDVDGSMIIDLPEDAFEEETAQVIDISSRRR